MKETERSALLIVDDNEINRAILKEMFCADYYVLEAENGRVAADMLDQYAEIIQIIILDLTMPVMDGFDVLRYMGKKNYLQNIPVVVVTAEESYESEKMALELGARDIIRKPFITDLVKRRIYNVISAHSYKANLEKLTLELSDKLKKSNNAMVDTLTAIIEHRSLESGLHIVRIKKFIKILLSQVAESCNRYNIDDETIELISEAASLHDIGKIIIPDCILNKPARLTSDEFDIMKSHTLEGGKIVRHFDGIQDKEYLQTAYDIAVYHHERWDGKGYPYQLTGDEIPLPAQVAAIADVYDALTTDRVYKAAYSHDEAMQMIIGGECGQFSPEMIFCLRRVADKLKELAECLADNQARMADDSADKEAQNREKQILNRAYRIDHYKYLTALKMSNTIMIEIDYDRDYYHTTNLASNQSLNLGKEGRLTEKARSFIVSNVHPEDRSRALDRLKNNQQAVEAGYKVDTKGRYRILNYETGQYEWCQIAYMKIETNNMLHHKALMAIRNLESDIGKDYQFTTQRKGSEMLKEMFKRNGKATAMFSELLRGFGDILFVTDFNTGEIIYGMEVDQDIVGRLPQRLEQLEDKTLLNIHPNDYESYRAQMQRIRNGVERDTIVFRCMNQLGEYVAFCKRVAAIRDETNQVTHAIGMIYRMDIDE